MLLLQSLYSCCVLQQHIIRTDLGLTLRKILRVHFCSQLVRVTDLNDTESEAKANLLVKNSFKLLEIISQSRWCFKEKTQG